jgi:Icc-related predicted phosphoesterase
MIVLSLSDIAVRFVYSPAVRQRFPHVDFVLGCGDLPYSYQEYVISMLDKPFFFVRGNHDKLVEYTVAGPRSYPNGAVDLHGKVIIHEHIILAGIEGCLRYREGPFQYTSREMWTHVFRLVPSFLANRALFGRFVDIVVTHAPPKGIHDQKDIPHQGVPAFRWLIDVFKPAYLFHGHVHVYRPDTVTLTQVGNTQVINTFGFRETRLDRLHARAMSRRKPIEMQE